MSRSNLLNALTAQRQADVAFQAFWLKIQLDRPACRYAPFQQLRTEAAALWRLHGGTATLAPDDLDP